MRFFDRVTTLIKADAHGVVESIEDQSLLLKQHVREAEIELARKRARNEALLVENNRIEQSISRHCEQIQTIDEDVGLALESGKDELARFAIKKLLPLKLEQKRLEERLKEVNDEHEKLAKQLQIQEQEFETLKARARAYIAQIASAENTDDVLVAPIVADEDVEMELLRRKQQSNKGGA